MKNGWPSKPLGEVCPIYNRKPEVFVGNRRYFSTGVVGPEGELSEPELVNFANRPSRAGCMPEVGDIGFARMKGTKKVVLIDESLKGALFSTGFCFIAPRPDVDPRFAFYFVTSDDFQDAKNTVAGDGIMGGIKNADAAAIEMPLPTLPEQQRIVGLLNAAFTGIATAKANAELNLQNAHALFESHLQSVFEKPDKGWEKARLGDVCEFENGDRGKNYPTRKDYVESGVPWINTGHIQPDGTLSEMGMHFITRDKYESLWGGKIQPRDLVYCLRGATLGKVALVEPLTEGAIASSLVIIRPGGSLDSRFLYYFLMSSGGRGFVKLYNTGAAQPNLAARSVAKYTIAFPKLTEQKTIVSKLESLSKETQRLETIYRQKLAALDELKKALLHQAFTGGL